MPATKGMILWISVALFATSEATPWDFSQDLGNSCVVLRFLFEKLDIFLDLRQSNSTINNEYSM